jgi:CheY-like chemotaxis protein
MSVTAFTVLYVEDDPNDVFLLQRAFQKAGVDVALASVGDGLEAEDYLAGREVSLS